MRRIHPDRAGLGTEAGAPAMAWTLARSPYMLETRLPNIFAVGAFPQAV
jgi:hypothetical protein